MIDCLANIKPPDVSLVFPHQKEAARHIGYEQPSYVSDRRKSILFR